MSHALWVPEHNALVCADAVGTAQYYRAPAERLASSQFADFPGDAHYLDFLLAASAMANCCSWRARSASIKS